MTTIRPHLRRWSDAVERQVQAAQLGARTVERGRIESIGDGIAIVTGLPRARLHELIELPGNRFGFVVYLGRDHIGCVLLDAADGLEAGQPVLGTGDVVRTAVGPALLGRVVDPLGRPLDGHGEINAERQEAIERPAPGITERDLITQPLHTGILAVDAMFPIGRGQRELILGDRGIGKTALAVDTILSQRDSDVICVYVAVGQKTASTRRVIDAIARAGAPERCITVVAGAGAPPGLQWAAPFAGFTIAEYFRDQGRHVLVVIDDLSKHAATHRELALLTRQPPGREAFPGDIFYLHARLLERAARLSPALGGGSLTALPIAETDGGNLSAYIPTNLISITDGQIVLDAKLFHEGRKPAVDIGRSVSRVGGKAQAPALRQMAGMLRLEYAQFLELEIFSRLGGATDERLRQRMRRGRAIREALTQPDGQPLRLAEEIALLMAVDCGRLDGLTAQEVTEWRAGIGALLDRHGNGLIARLREGKSLTPEDTAPLRAALIENAPA